jgi:ribonuclease BN (tRNA processing enzyme)
MAPMSEAPICAGVRLLAVAALSLLALAGAHAEEAKPAGRTQVVLLGTGTPRPQPERSGPATAIVVDGTAYLVDLGPGVVRRAQAAADGGIAGLAPAALGRAFVTHLHSDHTVGLPDLVFTPWVVGRKNTLHVYGPKGIAAMVEHVLAAWREDVEMRTQGMEQKWPLRVEAHEIEPGVVYRDDKVTVTAVPIRHGAWKHAYGYAFQTPDRRIVISGDTSPSPELAAACGGCDVLIHEVYASITVAPIPRWPEYRRAYHTSTRELGELAKQAKPGLLILHHTSQRAPDGSLIPEQLYLDEIEEVYSGRVVVGRDLEVY